MRYLPVCQETPYYCGPASLQMVLLRYGIVSEQTELAKRCETSATGTTLHGLRQGARAFGLDMAVIDRANYDLLLQYTPSEIPVVVNWWQVDDGHYSVVDDISQSYIHLADPSHGRIVRLDRKRFIRNWFDFTEGALHAPEDLILQRMLLFYRS